jgi:hypothetical protein
MKAKTHYYFSNTWLFLLIIFSILTVNTVLGQTGTKDPKNNQATAEVNKGSKVKKTQKQMAQSQGTITKRQMITPGPEGPKNSDALAEKSKINGKKSQKQMAQSKGAITKRQMVTPGPEGPKNNDALADKSKINPKKTQKQMANSQGTITQKQARGLGTQAPKNNEALAEINRNNNVNKKQKQMANNTGDMVIPKSGVKPPQHDNTVVVNDKPQRQLSKQMSKYQGDIVPAESQMKGPLNSGATVLVRETDRKQMKQMARYSGDLPTDFLAKRSAMRQEKNRQVSSYQGDILVRTLEARARRTRKKSKDIANYRGDLIVKRVKKGMHPSSVYQGGKVKNSYEAKEKYRKKILKKYGRTEGLEDANWQKQKQGPPKYDKREAEIWNLK